MGSYILEAKELCKTYVLNDKQQLNILKNVNLQISAGEFVSVMGPSGSGKSTLLYLISGMDDSTSGSVLFNGKNISSLSEKELSALRLTQMGFVFQQIHLLKNLSIFDNIILPAYAAGLVPQEQVKKRATELMQKVGIEGLEANDITQASGGQLQRVAICRALINNPSMIFGDEPTGALNSRSADEIMEILIELNLSGTTVLLVTHDAKVAAKTERVLYMIDGKLVAEYPMGKYRKELNDIKGREETLTKWLLKMNF